MEKSDRTQQERNKITKITTFSVPLTMNEKKKNISIYTNSTTEKENEKIMNQAFRYHSEGNIVDAAKYYQFFIDQGFKDQRVFSYYGAILKNLGKLKEAELTTLKALKLNPNFAEAHSNLGLILRSLGKLKEAESSCRRAIELNPNFAEAHSNLGIILRDLHSLKEAEWSQRKAIELNPQFANAHYNLGNILKDLGRLKEAELSTRKAIQINPNFANNHYRLSKILTEMKNFHQASLAIEKAINIDPSNHIYQGELSRINFIKEDIDET